MSKYRYGPSPYTVPRVWQLSHFTHVHRGITYLYMLWWFQGRQLTSILAYLCYLYWMFRTIVLPFFFIIFVLSQYQNIPLPEDVRSMPFFVLSPMPPFIYVWMLDISCLFFKPDLIWVSSLLFAFLVSVLAFLQDPNSIKTRRYDYHYQGPHRAKSNIQGRQGHHSLRWRDRIRGRCLGRNWACRARRYLLCGCRGTIRAMDRLTGKTSFFPFERNCYETLVHKSVHKVFKWHFYTNHDPDV